MARRYKNFNEATSVQQMTELDWTTALTATDQFVYKFN